MIEKQSFFRVRGSLGSLNTVLKATGRNLPCTLTLRLAIAQIYFLLINHVILTSFPVYGAIGIGHSFAMFSSSSF